MAKDELERGAELMAQICGVAAPSGKRYIDMTLGHVFSDLWADETLSVRDRRLIVLGILAANGQFSPMQIHMGMALKSGELDERELDEVVATMAYYAGWPMGSGAGTAAAGAVADWKKAQDEG